MPREGASIEYYEYGAVANYDKTRSAANKVAEVKRRLNAARSAEQDISACIYEIEHLHEIRSRITTTIRECTSQSGAMADSRSDATARIIDLEKRLYKDVDRFVSASNAVKVLVYRLKSDKQRAVMHRRYILGWDWEHIASDLKISNDAVYRLHGRALANISKFDDAKHGA